MFAFRWFEVIVLVSSVAMTAHTSVGQEVLSGFSSEISQVDVELILNAQTSLRRHFIRSLEEVRGRITELEGFDAVVGGIIQDLQTRNADPLKLLRYANSSEEQFPTSLIAEVLNNLQGGSIRPTIADWSSLLQTSGRPNTHLRSELLLKIQELSEPFVDFVLRGIAKNSIKANSKLLADVLYNFRFREYSPELSVILENVNQTLTENVQNFLDFHTDAALVKHPGDVLSDILKFISRKKQSDARLIYEIDQLLSALSDRGNAVQVKDTPELWGLFDLMLQDDYPPDVIQAKNTLSLAIRNNKVGVDLSGANEYIKGSPPMEKLLMLMTKLSGSSSFQREVLAVHPHIKLRYLTGKGQFFRPRTAVDVTFLLNSFLTVHYEMNPRVVEEVQRIFILSDWEEVLKNFDFSRYSKPRPLVVDMIQGLLNESGKLPLCSIIILRYFLSNNRQVSRCTGDGFREESAGLSAHGPRGAQESHPTAAPVTALPHLPVKPLFGSEWEASRLPPKRLSAIAPQPSPSVGATTASPAGLFTSSPPPFNSQRPSDSEGSTKPTAPAITGEPSSSVSLPPWPSTYGTTAMILPIAHSTSGRHFELPVYPLMTGASTIPTVPVAQPSVATALPDSPRTRTESLPPPTSPSPPAHPCTSPESSTSAYSQCRTFTVRSTLEVAATFLPLRRLDDTTTIDSVDQGSPSATEIQRHSSTDIGGPSTNPASMGQDETTSDEHIKPTSVSEGERTSSRPPGEADPKKGVLVRRFSI